MKVTTCVSHVKNEKNEGGTRKRSYFLTDQNNEFSREWTVESSANMCSNQQIVLSARVVSFEKYTVACSKFELFQCKLEQFSIYGVCMYYHFILENKNE